MIARCVEKRHEGFGDVEGIVGQRFTLDGSDELENRLSEICQNVLSGLRSKIPAHFLEAILLGGGYGRGEGGVFRTPQGDQPYNDMEFYVFLRGNTLWNERRWNPRLHVLSENQSTMAGLHVETKILSFAKLQRSPTSMFYYDLVAGHRWILGHEAMLGGCQHHGEPRRIPPCEATRLLMNRLSGLLFAQEKLRQKMLERDAHDYIVRNFAKLRLALGDAVLTAFGRYHWSCRERHKRLLEFAPEKSLPWTELIEAHGQGVEFKLHPHHSDESRDALVLQSAELTNLGQRVWLWLESRRLGHIFDSIEGYVSKEIDKCPETGANRNRLLNVKAFGLAEIFRFRAIRHPRERLFHSLALLLWSPESLCESRLAGFLRETLRTTASSFPELARAYETLWKRLN